jgi:hypothetical protein
VDVERPLLATTVSATAGSTLYVDNVTATEKYPYFRASDEKPTRNACTKEWGNFERQSLSLRSHSIPPKLASKKVQALQNYDHDIYERKVHLKQNCLLLSASQTANPLL